MKRHLGVFLDFEPTGGGTFQYACTLVKHLCSLPGVQVSVAYTQGNWPEIFKEDPVQLVPLQGGGLVQKVAWKLMRAKILPYALWRRISGIHPHKKNIESLKADFWFYPCQDFWSFFLACDNSIVSIHDLMHRFERRFEEVGSQYESREFLYKHICATAKKILVDSELGRDQVVEAYGFPRENIHVLPYTIPNYLHAQDERPEGLRFEPGHFFFYPAQFWTHKNHLGLLKALKFAEKEGHRFNLVLVGSKKNADGESEKFISENGLSERVQIMGYVPNSQITWLYRNSQGLVMPTFFGPTNIPPLEAMALGVPMAVSGIYAMREQSGDAALYFDPSKPEEIAQCLISLAQPETRSRLIAAAEKQREKVSEAKFRENLQRFVDEL